MKKQILIVGFIVISAITFGQKKEIKKAQKAIKSGNFTEAISLLNQAEGLIENAKNDLKAQYYIARGEAILATAGNDLSKLKMAGDAFARAIEISPKGNYASKANTGIQNLKRELENNARDNINAKKYGLASEEYYTAYSYSKQDTLYLFNAAISSGLDKNYDNAIKYYKALGELGYTGKIITFTAVEIETGEVKSFGSEMERNLFIKSGDYNKPETVISKSAQSIILRNLTIAYIEKGYNENALYLMKELREENPEDISLIRTEAEMVYKMGDVERYKELMQEVLSLDSTNPEIYFNLGVVSKNIGDNEKALEYYENALELKPDYAEVLINIADLLLSEDEQIIEEMNALGTSRADNKKYDELQAKRKELFTNSIPYLESASKLRPDKIELVKTLMNIYSQLGQDDKYKVLKSRLIEMEAKQ